MCAHLQLTLRAVSGSQGFSALVWMTTWLGIGSMISKANNGSNALWDVCIAIEHYFQVELRNAVARKCKGTPLESEAEDIERGAFSQLWQALLAGELPDVTVHNWKEEARLRWIRARLFGGAKFTRFDFYRRRRRWESIVDRAIVCTPNPGCPVVMGEIQAAIEQCTPAQREAFELTQDGWSPSEIAAKRGVSPATVRTNLHRARLGLMERLKDYA